MEDPPKMPSVRQWAGEDEERKEKTEEDLLNPDPYYGGLWLGTCLNIYYK